MDVMLCHFLGHTPHSYYIFLLEYTKVSMMIFLFVSFYLKGETLAIHCLSLQMPTTALAGQDKTRIFYVYNKRPRYPGHHLLPPRAQINSKLEWRVKQDSGTPIWTGDIPHGILIAVFKA